MKISEQLKCLFLGVATTNRGSKKWTSQISSMRDTSGDQAFLGSTGQVRKQFTAIPVLSCWKVTRVSRREVT